MDFFRDIFDYAFLSNALLASALSGLVCGIIGTYVVSRRIVFMSGGITHSSFGGIGVAYYLGINPILGALVFALLSAAGIEWASEKGRIREDSAIGIIWSVGMAVGIIFIYLTPGYAPNLMTFLFGNILTVTRGDILALAILAAIITAVFALWMRPIVYVAFDREFARSQGAPVRTVSYAMSLLVALAIVLSIRIVGIVLLISLLTIPPVIVNSFTKSYARITVWSCVVALAGNVTGLIISYGLNVPAGAAAIIALTVVLVVVKLLPLLGKLPYKLPCKPSVITRPGKSPAAGGGKNIAA